VRRLAIARVAVPHLLRERPHLPLRHLRLEAAVDADLVALLGERQLLFRELLDPSPLGGALLGPLLEPPPLLLQVPALRFGFGQSDVLLLLLLLSPLLHLTFPSCDPFLRVL
jgi:hypothetical protein